MSHYRPQPPLYDRRRLEQMVMEHRMKALLQTRKSSPRRRTPRANGK